MDKTYRTIKTISLLLSAVLFIASCGTDEKFPDPGPPQQPGVLGKAKVWVTRGDQSKLLAPDNDIIITERADAAVPVITVNAAERLQEIDGFGAALTGSSAYLIQEKLTAAQRSSLLTELFDADKGIGISYLRMTIGASDFSLTDYTYDDMPAGETDYTLEHFTIEKDREHVIPVFRQILSIAPSLKVMASPWSAPGWMKTNGSLSGGKLRPEAYDVYARYFAAFIDAYKAEGIAIDAVTPQNEPLHFTATYPCMEMQATEQLKFIKDHLGPVLATAAPDTKIVVYDHNWDNTQYAITILNDAAARPYISGSAFHAYGGNVSAMSVVHSAHPDKGLYFTEISGGEWATDFGDNLQWNMANIFIGTTKNWSRNALLWNLALDENHGPKNGGCQDCRGVVTINSATGQVTKNVEYYSVGHFSKFVRPGARRIVTSDFESASGLNAVAFVNGDGSNVLVVSNTSASPKPFVAQWDTGQFRYVIAARSVATIIWE